MTGYDDEPIRGLPGLLPPGERILWQGKPDARILARTAFHAPVVAAYFVLLAGWGLAASAGPTGVVGTLATGTLGLGLLYLLAFATARSTVYTLTDRRLVLRIGVAVPKCINLPLGQIRTVDLALRRDGSGDLPMRLAGRPRLGYLALWPHARAWHVVAPQPMMRALPDAAGVAALMARACLAADPQIGTHVEADVARPAPGLIGAVAA